MPSFTSEDFKLMAQALALASAARYTTAPNPSVGCVLVNNAEVVGLGFHRKAGLAHAEVEALKAAGERAQGATAYVTLEPCAHSGKTGPCANALVEAGVSKVLAAMQDPNPAVAGKGFEILEAAGIKCFSGLMEQEARALNPGFIKRMETGLPYVRLKQAMSLDGRTAMKNGESQWITASDARADVQAYRALSQAIISGVDSILMDDSALTVRVNELPNSLKQDSAVTEFFAQSQPLRVIVDSQLRTPHEAKILKQPGHTLIATLPFANTENETRQQRAKYLQAAGAEIIQLPAGQSGRVDLKVLLALLAERQCNEVLVEAGATLAGEFMQQGLVDEMLIYMAAKLMGDQARALLNLPFESMSEAINVSIKDIRAIGCDWRIIATPEKN